MVIVYPDHRTVAKRIRTTAAEVTSPFRPGARMKATVVETASLVSGGVMGTNQAPTAAADAYTTAEDTVLTVNTPGVLGNDSDPDGNTLSAVLGSGPSHGTLTLNANGSFTYTPAADYHGSDSFTYRTGDGSLTSNPVTVTLTVSATNDPPTVAVAAGGTCGTDDHSGTVKLTVADVDSPPAGLTLSAASSNPALVPTGNVVFAGSGAPRTMTVNAVDGRSDTAILTVTVSDGQASGTVWVTVTVGGSGKDTLTGSTGADLLLAQSNNDTLTGGDGKDLLCGDSGGDTVSGGTGDDSLGGGTGSPAGRARIGSAAARSPRRTWVRRGGAAHPPIRGRLRPAAARGRTRTGCPDRLGGGLTYQAGARARWLAPPPRHADPGEGSMPPEQEDARARQIEALRRYVAQLGTQRERPTELGMQQEHPKPEPPGSGPAPVRWRPSLPLTGLLVALALLGGVFVGAVAWSNHQPAATSAVAGGSSAAHSPDTATPVATPACKTAVDRANALLTIAVKLQRELAEYSRFMRDPSNGNLAVREVVDKRAPSLQAGADDSARFDRALADYRQIVDRCAVRTP